MDEVEEELLVKHRKENKNLRG